MEQFHAFLLCAACGIAGGALYDLFYFFSYHFKQRPVPIAADVLFCIVFAGGYLFFSTALSLPPMRFYLFAGLCLGFLLYIKSFHKIVAFFAKKVYNNSIQEKNSKRKRMLWRKRRKFRKKRREGSQ